MRDRATGKLSSVRPHVGFFLGEGCLVWIAEESRDGDRSVYSLFFETVHRSRGGTRYRIIGSDFTWDRSTRRVVSALKVKAGQYSAEVEGTAKPPRALEARAFGSTRFRVTVTERTSSKSE